MKQCFRPLRLAALALAAVSVGLVLGACEQLGGPPGEQGGTIAVTMAPSLGEAGISAQGVPADLAIADVEVFVRATFTSSVVVDPVCFVFANDGTYQSVGANPDECAFSIWDSDARSVTPRTLQIPPRDVSGDPIQYDFFLNVRSSSTETTAFASEAIPELTSATTLRFENLISFLSIAEFSTTEPEIEAYVEPCPPLDLEVEPGETISLFLITTMRGVGGTICFDGTPDLNVARLPFTDFGIGPATVELDALDITSTALLNVSKRGLQITIPGSAAPGQTVEVSLPVNGTAPQMAADSSSFLVDGTQGKGVVASISLQVIEPPVSTDIDPDLTPPTIETARANLSLTEALLTIGTFPDPDDVTDVADVIAFLGVQEVALQRKTVFADSNANGAFVNYQAYICSDFARFVPALGEPGTELELKFYVFDPIGNQSASFTAPITVNTLYSGPSGSCTATSTL